MQKKKPSARKLGIGLLVFGVLFVVAFTALLLTGSLNLSKLTFAGFVMIGLGLGMVFFPGQREPGQLLEDVYDTRVYLNKPAADNLKPQRMSGGFSAIWGNLRLLDKIMWLVFALLGVGLAYFYFNFLGLSLMPY